MYDEIDRYLDDSELDPADGGRRRSAAIAADPIDLDPDALGPCGCIDYHLADCPVRGRS